MKPRTECFCHFSAAINSSSDAPFFREIRLSRISFLLPAFFSVVIFFVVLLVIFFAAVGAAAAAGSDERSAAGAISSGSAVVEIAGAASFCTSAKMRFAATPAPVNFLTGVTPVRPFQISTILLLSAPISSANFSAVPKTPSPVRRAIVLLG